MKSHALALLTCLAASLNGGTLVLQNGLNGYSGCSDTYLVMGADNAQGAKDKLVVEGYHCSACIDQRALIRFDLSSRPSSGDISSAALSIYSIDQPRPGPARVDVYRVNRSWSEGVAGWMTAEPTIGWARQGGDFVTPRDTFYQYGTEIAVWHVVVVTSMIRDFLARPERNFGLMLYMEPTMLTVRYASSGNADQSLRPKLTIEGSELSAAGRPGRVRQSRLSTVLRVQGRRITSSVAGRIVVTDLHGREVLAEDAAEIDVSGIPAGYYLVGLKLGAGSVVQRVGLFQM